MKLGLALLQEARRGTESQWQLYVEALPKRVETLVHWSDAELQQLHMDSTAVEKELINHVRSVPRINLIKLLINLIKNLINLIKNLINLITKQDQQMHVTKSANTLLQEGEEGQQLTVACTTQNDFCTKSVSFMYFSIIPCLRWLQAKQQLVDIEEDYDKLKTTPIVSELKISFEDLLWASDMCTSRSYAIQKQIGAQAPVSFMFGNLLCHMSMHVGCLVVTCQHLLKILPHQPIGPAPAVAAVCK